MTWHKSYNWYTWWNQNLNPKVFECVIHTGWYRKELNKFVILGFLIERVAIWMGAKKFFVTCPEVVNKEKSFKGKAGESNGQRILAGYSPWGCRESETTEQLTHPLNLSFLEELFFYFHYAKKIFFLVHIQRDRIKSLCQDSGRWQLSDNFEKQSVLFLRAQTLEPDSGLEFWHQDILAVCHWES